MGVEPWRIEEGSFYLIKIETEREKNIKIFVRLALELHDIGTIVTIKYMRKKKLDPATNKSTFVFPDVDDISDVDIADIISQVALDSVRKWHYILLIICKVSVKKKKPSSVF